MANKIYKPSVEEITESNDFLSDMTIGTTHVERDQDMSVSTEGILDNMAIRAKEWFQSDDKYYDKQVKWDFKVNKIRAEAENLQIDARKKTAVKQGAPLITLSEIDAMYMSSGLVVPKTIAEFQQQISMIEKLTKLLTEGIVKDYENFLRVLIDTSKAVIRDNSQVNDALKKIAVAGYPITANKIIKTQSKILRGGNKFNETSDILNGGLVLTRYVTDHAGVSSKVVWFGTDKEFHERMMKSSYTLEALTPAEVIKLTELCSDATDVMMEFSNRFAATNSLYNQASGAINTFISFVRTPEVTDLDITQKNRLASYLNRIFNDIDTFMTPWIYAKNNAFIAVQSMMLICRKSIARQQ